MVTQAPSVPAQQDPTLQTIATFLAYARKQFHISQVGSIPAGASGGTSSSQVTFVPTNLAQDAVYADSIYLYCTLPIKLTLPATSGTATVSPYFPYSAITAKFTVAGASRFEYMSGTPHWLDELTSYEWFDPLMSYPSSYGAISGQFDNGSSATSESVWYPNGDGGGAFQPGATITNTTSAAVSTYGVVQFRVKVRLRRRRPNLWGCVPLGDPQNLPALFVQLSALIGTDPVTSAFTSASSSATAILATSAGNAAGTVLAVYPNLGIDVLPAGVPVPVPLMQMAYALNYDGSTPITAAGTVLPVNFKTDMLYDKIFMCLSNNQLVQDVDYFALWLTNKEGSARWKYNVSENSWQNYFETLHNRYKRYFPTGCLINDMYSGDNPEFPATTPYKAAMSPDSDYAALEGVPPAPLMTEAFRIPTGTSLTSPKIDVFELGVQRATY